MPNCSAVVRVHVAFVVDDYLAVDVKHSEEKERLRRWTSEWVSKMGISTIYDSFNTVSIQFQYSFNTVSIQFQYSFNTVSIHFQYSFNTVSIQFQYSFNTVSIQFQYSFNTVSMGYGIAMGYESDIMEYEYVFFV